MLVEPLPPDLFPPIEAEMRRLQVPGAALGVLHDGRAYTASFGITSVEHPLPVTDETLFQVGSTSKTFTATAFMQLVEQDAVSLDAPVRTYLPDFRLASEEDAARLTLHHLVTHHGGFLGDDFQRERNNRGDDALAQYVAGMATTAQLTPAGYTFSYSNAGLYIVGRVIEVITGQPFERVIRKRIFSPLGMRRSTYFPEFALPHRVAAGHIITADGPVVARPWHVPRTIAPGGGVISNVVEQLAYAAFHLGDGSAPGGERLLEPASMALMQRPHAAAGSMCDAIGVTWMLSEIGGVHFVFHGGATNGHLSSFELAPSKGFALTLLTNSDTGRGLRPFVSELARHYFLGISPSAPPAISLGRGELDDYAGRYEQTLANLDVSVADGGLQVQETPATLRLVEPLPLPPTHAEPIAADRFAITRGDRRGETIEFLRDDSGDIAWMRWDGRISRRTPARARR